MSIMFFTHLFQTRLADIDHQGKKCRLVTVPSFHQLFVL